MNIDQSSAPQTSGHPRTKAPLRPLPKQPKDYGINTKPTLRGLLLFRFLLALFGCVAEMWSLFILT
ncbi:MAG: hypothetical protein V4539_08845 [Bacteroidota bacterium]